MTWRHYKGLDVLVDDDVVMHMPEELNMRITIEEIDKPEIEDDAGFVDKKSSSIKKASGLRSAGCPGRHGNVSKLYGMRLFF